MKKTVFLILLGLVVFSFSQVEKPDPENQNPPKSLQESLSRHCGKLDTARFLSDGQGPNEPGSSGSAWTSIGPEGGDITGLVAHPTNPSLLYATTANPGRIYQSSNGGLSWSLQADLGGACYDLSIDPINPNNLYVLGNSQAWKSTNGGTTWASVAFPSYVYCYSGKISIAPSNPSILYATGYYYYDQSQWKSCPAVLKSTDSGQNWTVFGLSTTSSYSYLYALAVSPTDSSLVYVGGYEYNNSAYRGCIYKTVNGGTNWTDIAGPLASYNYVYSLAVDPTNANKVFAGNYAGIWRTDNGGSSWTKNSGTAYAYYGLTVSPSLPTTIYAGYYGDLYVSTNGGVDWTYYSTNGTGAFCKDLLVVNSALYYASSTGIGYTPTGGLSFQALVPAWEKRNAGIIACQIPVVGVAPSAPRILYADVGNDGFYKSTDSGRTWTKCAYFNRCENVLSLYIHPTDPLRVVALAGG